MLAGYLADSLYKSVPLILSNSFKMLDSTPSPIPYV
jgi:hypothetical protein